MCLCLSQGMLAIEEASPVSATKSECCAHAYMFDYVSESENACNNMKFELHGCVTRTCVTQHTHTHTHTHTRTHTHAHTYTQTHPYTHTQE